MSVIPAIRTSTIDVLFRPSRFVRSRISTYASSLRDQATVFIQLVAIFVFNLVLYSVPITLSGIETVSLVPPAPPLITSILTTLGATSSGVWDFLYRVTINAGFLVAGSATAFFMFHVGVVFLRKSEGVLQSLHTIIYTSSIYLAGMFTVTWFASTAESILVADQVLINYQKRIIYFFIDLTNRDLGLPGGRPESVPTDQLTTLGEFVIFALLLLSIYFIYSLYLGAKINHNMTRADALLTTLIVMLSPAIYIVGSIVYTTSVV